MLQKLLRKDTRVISGPGNHGEFACKYLGHHFGGAIQCAQWLAHAGEWLGRLTVLVEHADGRLEIVDWSTLKPRLATARQPGGQGVRALQPAAGANLSQALLWASN